MSVRPRALVLSPTATHPRDYGNRNRVWQTTKFLQDRGYEIHFVLYPIEDDWQRRVPGSSHDMRSAWTSFTVVPPSVKLHSRAAGEYHGIDEWWDPQIGHHLTWLLARQSFTLMVVNYAFLSKAFELASGPIVKVLETHDMFSGRKEMLASLGIEPEFFYTTPDQERIAFDRADIVVAIKESEAKIIAERTAREVVTLPFYPDTPAIAGSRPAPAVRAPAPEVLRVGFIGANNQVNIANVQRFLDLYERYEFVYSPPIEIVIAGGVCRHLTTKSQTVQLVGRVPDIREFYENIDVIVVPLRLSTGIKIKTGEALGMNVPVVSTSNGFDGYPPVDEYHNLPGLAEVCDALVRLAFDRSRLDALAERTRMAARLAEHRAAAGYSRLAAAIRRRAARIAIVTDRDVLTRPTMADERMAQWIELCSHIAPTLLVVVGERPAELEELAAPLRASQIEMIEFSDRVVDDVEKALLDNDTVVPIGEVVLSIAADYGRMLLQRVKPHFPALTADLWAGNLAAEFGLPPQDATEFDLWALAPAMPGLTVQQLGLMAAPLRYVPARLHAWAAKDVGEEVVVILCGPTEGDNEAVEILRHRFAGVVSVFGAEGDLEAGREPGVVLPEAGLFDHLLAGKKPSRIVAVGSDRRKARLYRELARQAGICFGRVACAELPYLHPVPGNPPFLCVSANDAVRCACAPAPAAALAEAAESRWDRYWDLAVAKIQRLRQGQPAASSEAAPGGIPAPVG